MGNIIKKRIPYWDNIKGILILLVVVGHLLEALPNGTLSILYKLIYIFHMPLFVFCSGYLARYSLIKILKRFLLPYCILQPICCLIDGQTIQFSTPVWILWYLLAISIWYMSLPLLDKCDKKSRPFIIILSIILACLLGYDDNIGYYGSISRVIVFYPYFIIGYFGKKYYIEKTYNHIVNEYKHIIKLVIIVLLVFIIGSYIFYAHIIDPKWLYGAYSYRNGHYTLTFRIMQYFVSFVIGCFILLFIPKKSSLITKWGFNSFLIYLSHVFVIPIIRYIISIIQMNNFLLHILCIAIAIIFCTVLHQIVEKTKQLYKTQKELL